MASPSPLCISNWRSDSEGTTVPSTDLTSSVHLLHCDHRGGRDPLAGTDSPGTLTPTGSEWTRSEHTCHTDRAQTCISSFEQR